jgi:hypothetical protein
MEPSLQTNISLKYVLAKPAPDVIEEQLQINILIQTEILSRYSAETPKLKLRHDQFDLSPYDSQTSYLNLRDQPRLIRGAFKFMTMKDIRQVDLSNCDLQDAFIY